MPLNDALAGTGAAGIIYAENGTKHKTMTNSSKADLMTGGGGGSGGGCGSGGGALIGGGGGVSLASLQGQKWSQVFDMDKMIKQLRTAEKAYLRGGGGGKATGSEQAKLHVQRLNAADMAYYDIVPKLATRDLVVCNTCNGSYTKAGFQNHIALQHPAIWEATSNKVNPLTATGDNSTTSSQQETAAAGGGDSLAGGSPTETLSASTMSSCSNGSSSSTSQHTAANATSSSSSSSSSRHKSSTSSSSKSSSSSSKGSSGTSSRSRSKSSKNRHHSSPAPAPELKEKTGGGGGGGGGGSSKKSSSSSAIAAPPVAATAAGGGAVAASIKEEFTPAPITVFSSSSNSSCSLPPSELVGGGVGLNYSPANHQQAVAAVLVGDEKPPELQPKKKPKVSSDHRTKASKDKPVGQVGGSQYEQQQQQQQVGLMSELDQAVSSITGQVESQEGQPTIAEEEELPLPNTSDENSISLTLDEMLDSKLINEILKNFDESALDTAQQQQQQQQPNGASLHATQASKRLRYDDVAGEMGEEYIYQQQTQQQQQQSNQQQQVYGEDNQSQLTTIDAMQLQQLIYQQQQMLEQAEQQQQHKQELPEEQAGQQQQQQFSVYNVQSLTDDAEVQQQQQQQEQQQQQLDEHMILPSIIYEITDTNPVSVLEQQKVIAEFLTQAGYENVDVNVLQAATGGGTAAAAAAGTTTTTMGVGVGVGDVSQFNDDLNDFDFTKLETVSDKTTTTTTPTTTTTTKTVKLEATNSSQRARTAITATTANIHIKQRSLIHAKCHEESYFNVMHYSGQPRPLAMNTFGLVKLPNGLGATLRKNLLTTRKANNTLLSLNGGTLGVVGQLARPPPPAPQANNYAALSNGTGMLVKNAAAAAGKTIYAQKSSVIAQDRLRCNKRALVSPRLEAGKGNGNGLMTVKRLNELLLGKAVKKEKPMDNEEPDQQQQQQKEELEQQQQQLDHKLTHSFYEKRRKLLAKSQQQQQSPKRQPQQQQQQHQQQQPQYLQQQQQQEQVLRQRSPNFSLPLQNNSSNAGQNSQPLLKKQLLRTLSDSSSNILAIAANNSGNGNSNSNTPNANSNPWKSQSSTPGGGGSTPSSSDLMRVFV